MVRICSRRTRCCAGRTLVVAVVAFTFATMGCLLKKDPGETAAGGGGAGASSTGGTGSGAGGTGGAEPQSDWVASDSGAAGLLEAVWAEGDLVMAVGAAGTIVRSDDAGASWADVPSGVSADLHGVWHDGTRAWIVGAAGTVLYSEDAGATFALRDPGVTDDLTAVWGLGPNDVLVSALGVDTLHSGDGGESWSSLSSLSLAAFWGIDSSLIYGISQRQVHRSEDGGDSWLLMTGSYANTDHQDIWAHSSGVIVTVTSYGSVFTYDGSWTYTVPLGQRVLHGIWGAAPDNLFIVGDGGSVLRSSTQDKCLWIDTELDLHDVHGSAGRVHVVGESGMTWNCAY